MFRDPSSNLIFVARQRRLQEPPAALRRCAPDAEHHATWLWVSPADRAMLHRARQVVVASRQAVAARLRWVANFPYDSRERLGSKEQELAMLGISWATDPLHDAALAREIEVARQRRRAAGEVALVAALDTETSAYQRAFQDGDFDTAAIFAGEAVDLIDAVVPAGELVQRIGIEAEARLRNGLALLA
jgi:hypothetical protein